jgi:hypothetical protein
MGLVTDYLICSLSHRFEIMIAGFNKKIAENDPVQDQDKWKQMIEDFKDESNGYPYAYACGVLKSMLGSTTNDLKQATRELQNAHDEIDSFKWALELITDHKQVDSWDFKSTVKDTIELVVEMIADAKDRGYSEDQLKAHFDKGFEENDNVWAISDDELVNGELDIRPIESQKE